MDKFLAEAQKLDLSQNVFFEGTWGTYMCVSWLSSCGILLLPCCCMCNSQQHSAAATVRRLLPSEAAAVPRLPSETPYGAHMDIGQYGDLNSLHWVENEFDPSPNMLHCEVVYGEDCSSALCSPSS